MQRLALPEDNLKAVFNQMRAERSQFAAKFQAENAHFVVEHPDGAHMKRADFEARQRQLFLHVAPNRPTELVYVDHALPRVAKWGHLPTRIGANVERKGMNCFSTFIERELYG